ncbi:protein adenylyltransferase SelO family protein, partial [Bradyrhizobium sp.]
GNAAADDAADVRAQFTDPAAFDEWANRWRARLALEPQSAAERKAAMAAVNPAFIPRNHRIEAVIAAAVNADDYAPFEELLTVLAKPYEDQTQFAAYADPPLPEQMVTQTFCGT